MPSGKMLTRMWMVAVAGAAITACGGEAADETTLGDAPAGDAAPVATTPVTPGPTDTAAGAAPGTTPATTPAPGASAPAPAASGQAGGDVAAGQAVYSGPGICFTCHGPAGAGTALAPNLTDSEWLWFDARPSLDELVTLINTGVTQPKEHPAPMPARGSGSLSDEQVRNVAAYVLSLSGG